MATTGTVVSETDIFASSTCHCNIITLVHVKMLIVENIGHFDVEIDLAGSRDLEGMDVDKTSSFRRCDRLPRSSRCDHARLLSYRWSSMKKWQFYTFLASVFPHTQCGATGRGDRGMPESSRTRAHPS